MQELVSSIQIYEDPQKRAELNRMKRIATGLLILVTVVFVIGSIYEDQYFWMGFVRAGAEAAMVGAIADWFAVTALFRHPLGLKIPHTAILPRRKDSFGKAFGQFVQTNFLSGRVIAARLHSINVALLLANWMGKEENSAYLAEFATATLSGGVQVIKDEDIQEFIEHAIVTQVRAIEITPVIGNFMALVLSGDRKQDLFSGGIKMLHHFLEENRTDIRQKISSETPWWMPQAVDNRIYQKLLDAIEDTLTEVNSNPKHPLQQRFSTEVDKFVIDLKENPQVIAHGEELKEDFLRDPGVQDFSASLWLDVKTSLLEKSAYPDSNLRRPIQQGIVKLSQAIEEDQALQLKINQWVEDAAMHLVNEYGHEAGDFISHTISEWDAKATSRKIELHVGKDLQYIRINGTLVGGLVGLVLHTINVLLL